MENFLSFDFQLEVLTLGQDHNFFFCKHTQILLSSTLIFKMLLNALRMIYHQQSCLYFLDDKMI